MFIDAVSLVTEFCVHRCSVPSKRVVGLSQKTEAFEHRMYSHPLHNDPKLEDLYNIYERRAKVSRAKCLPLSRFCTGRFVPVDLYRSVCTGRFVPVDLYRSICIGQFVPVRLYRSVCTGRFVPVHLYRSICTGRFVPVGLYRSVFRMPSLFCCTEATSIYSYFQSG